jgi:hypothetical protein
VTAPASVGWDDASGTLTVDIAGDFAPARRESITITGIRAGPPSARCCHSASIVHDTDQNGITASACVRILCPVRPDPVTGLRAVRSAGDVSLSWDVASDGAAASYNVWRVIDRDKTLIPIANRTMTEQRPGALRRSCYQVPLAMPSCIDAGAVGDGTSLLFYQVRAACVDGVEGTAHPF